jgi:ribosomal protein S18 acetylase RimI-like enzyme
MSNITFYIDNKYLLDITLDSENNKKINLIMDNIIVGYSAIFINYLKDVHIQAFNIKPEYQGYGNGSKLYKLLENYIKNDIIYKYKLNNNIQLSSIDTAVIFWEKMGYHYHMCGKNANGNLYYMQKNIK